MKKTTIKRLNFLIVLLLLAPTIYSQEINSGAVVIPAQSEIDKEVELTFNSITARKTTGSVIIIDVQEELKKDQSSSIGEIINGKVPGVIGNYNTWGTGNAVLLVDGIRQWDFYLNTLNPMEIESIVILKDGVSKARYGAQGDAGVILITSKRGEAGTHQLRVFGQYSAASSRALPKYLGAADYMEKYNEAQLNDGIDPASLRYSLEAIEGTRSGENPARYPDNDFYSGRYIKDNTTNASVFADVSGGSESARYYVNTGWEQNSGWLNTPQGDITDNLSFRGNLDVQFNEYLDMNVNTSAKVSFNEQPNASSIWQTASTEFPNNYPVLWNPGLITNTEVQDFVLSVANLEDGQVLGGNSSFLDNVYGNLTQNGNRRDMQRDLQIGAKINLDMKFITEGLSASMYGGMHFFNTLRTQQNPSFAVYEPVFDEGGQIDSVIVHGKDEAANRYNTNSDNSDFFRHISYYGTLNYDRSFGEHDFSAVALMYADLFTLKDILQ
nr:TonB-dependent receptor plug domain-containing protein [Sunxiuqinia sp.]